MKNDVTDESNTVLMVYVCKVNHPVYSSLFGDIFVEQFMYFVGCCDSKVPLN